jgi:hypothetical protein
MKRRFGRVRAIEQLEPRLALAGFQREPSTGAAETFMAAFRWFENIHSVETEDPITHIVTVTHVCNGEETWTLPGGTF